MRGLLAWFIAVLTVLSIAMGSGTSPAGGLSSPTLGGSHWLPGSRAGTEPLSAPLSTVAHDLTVSSANVTTLAGMSTNYSDAISGVAPQSTTWWWGDGTTTISSSDLVSHTYANPGIYLIYAEAVDATDALHDNLGSLLRFAVLDSYTNDSQGNAAQLQGSVVANQSATSSADGVLPPGGWVQVSNWVTNEPTDPQWTLGTPSYQLSNPAMNYANQSTLLGEGLNLSGATIGWSNSTPQGSYQLNFSIPTVNNFVALSGETWNNFTFTIFVSTSAATPLLPLPTSPHNGTLQVYQVTSIGPGQLTLDPALADDPTSGPILQNLYQTLIVYNGSQAGPEPSDFVPDLATCVPGSSLCTTMYGSSLVTGDNWTFVINPNATFYNASTGASWSVFPNDVAFSFARSCALANSNGPEGFEDFVLCQALLPSNANGTWDGGIHSPWNNTPSNILAAISVNNSRYCTSEMEDGMHGNGCITLDTASSGRAWPEFLELVESTSGWAVASCSWEASQGLGLPGWTNGSACYPAPPGSTGNPNPVPGVTAWDSYELSQGSYGSFPITALTNHALGSGPYALVSFNDETGYTLEANPDWGGTTCQGGVLDGCLPPATKGGHSTFYLPAVDVHFETSDGPGLAAMAAGDADLIDTNVGGGNAGYGGDGSVILGEVRSGELDYVVGPAITTSFSTLDLRYNVTSASALTGSEVTLPAQALEDLNFRQFLIASYPHTTAQQNNCIVDGILYCFSMGGAIPVGMGAYYPANISWPLTDANPDPSTVGSAAWWWSQAASDPMIGASCKPANPCTFPLQAFSPGLYQDFELWAQTMQSISQGAIQPIVLNENYTQVVSSQYYVTPGNSSSPLGWGSWAPDYFDPSDYANPEYLPNSFWTTVSEDQQDLSMPQYESSCAGPVSDPLVTTDCQGTAYAEMTSLLENANVCSSPACSTAHRALLYNMAEQIANGLGIDLSLNQQAAVYAFAPWIDGSSLLLNPDRNDVYGGATSNQPFFFIQYATAIPQGHTLQVSLDSPGAASSGPLSPQSLAHPGGDQAGQSLVIEAGQTFITLVSVTGGTGIYRYIWDGLPTGCTTLSTAVLSCRPSEGGNNVSMTVSVVDTRGDIGVSGALPIQVVAHVSIDLFVASPSNVTLGQSVSFSVSATGGIGALTYAYVGLPPGCAASDAPTVRCTPTLAGHYSVTASVTDTVGIQGFATAIVNVTSVAPPPTSPSHPTTFLSLPGVDGYILVGGLALVAVLAGVGYWFTRIRRSKSRSESGTTDSSAAAGRATSEGTSSGPSTRAASGGLSTSSAGPSSDAAMTGGAAASSRTSLGPVSSHPDSVVCPACGAMNRGGAKFCDQCAKALPP